MPMRPRLLDMRNQSKLWDLSNDDSDKDSLCKGSFIKNEKFGGPRDSPVESQRDLDGLDSTQGFENCGFGETLIKESKGRERYPSSFTGPFIGPPQERAFPDKLTKSISGPNRFDTEGTRNVGVSNITPHCVIQEMPEEYRGNNDLKPPVTDILDFTIDTGASTET
jgi:hypothetical protein